MPGPVHPSRRGLDWPSLDTVPLCPRPTNTWLAACPAIGDTSMTRLLALSTFLAAIILSAGPAPADEKGKDSKDGWVQLFNGKDLTGWKVYPSGTGKWKVE